MGNVILNASNLYMKINTNNFLKAIDTLKLYRRSELMDEEGKRLIEELYVDPLPNDHVLTTILRPNSTFLVGRKGTGKSTIFQRAQEVLDKDKEKSWAYIDIKTLFESSTSELVGLTPTEISSSLSHDSVKRIAIFKKFMTELVKEIKKQIDARINSSRWERIKSRITGSSAEIFENLDEFIEDLESNNYLNITGSVAAEESEGVITKNSEKLTAELAAEIGKDTKIDAKIVADLISEYEQRSGKNYSQIYIRIFDVKGLIERLKEILSTLNLRHLYIFVDDFSELPRDDMEEVVDAILSPFNNWSDEFIKLKVAVYPGRVYLGEIDRSKVDEVYLDIYRAYGRNDVSGMEERAIDFTRRLVLRRLDYFTKQPPETYLDSDNAEFWRTVFYSCLGNPRILGYILYYAYETNTVFGNKINIRAVQDASRRYYEEKIYEYFRLNKFLHETFEERSSIYSLKELLEEIVKRAKILRTYRDSKLLSELHGRPPTSHFHVIRDYDSVLSSLELNFFITKYYEMRDRDGRDVSVYALNYGLCQHEAINFGRPREKREHRTYFVERVFDYTPIISSYVKVNQEIVCEKCGERHSHEMLPAIQAFNMLCPVCREGHCRVINLSRKYEKLINEVEEESLLPQVELGILKTLHDDRRTMFAKEIAAELDCSYQLVGKRGRNLAERDLLNRDTNEQGRRVFKLSQVAESVYFSESDDDQMDFIIDGE